MTARDKLRSGDFNTMNVEQQADGSQVITLTKEGDDKVYRFRVRNLCQPDEQEVDYATGEPIA